MKTAALLAGALSLGALASPTATAGPADPVAGPAAQELDLGSEIRRSIRWLRSVQDPIGGCYGGGVEGTALALKALALCPDHYRYQDGPFVGTAVECLVAVQAEDGAIADSEAEGTERERQTRVAVEALMLAPHASSVEALAGGFAFLGEDSEDWDPEALAGPSPENPLARAKEILADRHEDYYWEGPRGSVIETAERLVELAACVVTEPARPSSTPVVELPPFDPADRKEVEVARRWGAKFLNSLADPGGRFGAPGHPHVGMTAMALAALATLPEPRGEDIQSTLDNGLFWLTTMQNEDGSIHDGELANYSTSAALLALGRADSEGHAEVIARGRAFLERLQLDEGEGYSEGDVYYGGIGYGSTERPDLSNLQMALEALSASGLEAGAPTYEKALRFLQRTQNRSESNDVRIVDGKIVITSGDDGGAAYMPGDSKAGFVELEDGTRVPRSYGSMTYALLKCYVLAGLPRDDPRLQAAMEWCRKNYTLDVNPGFEHLADPAAAYQGLFYYFLTMAQALDAWGDDYVVTADGVRHHWRAELCGRIIELRNRFEGYWVNRNSPRWYEGNPLLATAYALLTLDVAMPGERR